MNKNCNIYARFPITCFSVPIVGHATLNLTSEEIYKCLCARAEVYEILPNGKSINLNFSNYDKDNCEELKPVVEEEKVVTLEDKVETKDSAEETESVNEVLESEPVEEKLLQEQDPVKTHQVASRNNNYQKNYNNKKGKNKR